MTFRIKLFMLLEIRVSQLLAKLGVALKLLFCEARESRMQLKLNPVGLGWKQDIGDQP